MFLQFLYLDIIPSLLICNKLSNEWSDIFVDQVLLLELKKIEKKNLEDLSSNGQKFDFSAIRTNVRSN